MSKSVKILATVVPNPYKRKKNSREFHFSVSFSPRLPETGILYDYFEINNWDKFLKMFITRSNFYLQLGLEEKTVIDSTNLIHSGILCSQYTFNVNHEVFRNAKRQFKDTDDFSIGGKIWKSIFKSDTPVEGWYYDVPQEIRNIASYQTIITKESFEEIKSIAPPKDAVVLKEVGKSMHIAASTFAIISNKVGDLITNSTSPETQRNFREKRQVLKSYKNYVDIKNYKTNNPKSEIKKENQEFHKKFSILSHYPDILRATGWILDFCFEVDVKTLRKANICRLQISYDETNSIDDTKPKFGDEIEFICPWTPFNHTREDTLFSLRYKTENDTYFQVKKGFINTIKNSPLRNPTITAQAEDSKRQIMDIISTFLPPDTKVDSNGRNDNLNMQIDKLINDNKEDFKSKISTGIGVIIDNNPAGLGPDEAKTSLAVRRENPQIIWGEDLDVGYRIDVSDRDDDVWYSLCKRKADYYIDIDERSNRKKVLLLKEYSDEPWVAESAQLGASGTGYIHEEICRWNNWSLTCPHTGRDPEFNQDQNLAADKEYNDLEIKNVKPDGKLFPLRFNKGYKFRLRVVDICGNSASVSDLMPDNRVGRAIDHLVEIGTMLETVTRMNGELYYFTSEQFVRFEDIQPPELFFAEDRFKEEEYYEEDTSGFLKPSKRRVLKDKFHGEDLYTLVIRHYDEEYKKHHDVDNVKKSIRIVAPPHVTPHFAEVQGAFDVLLREQDEDKRKKNVMNIYNLCKGNPKDFYDWTFWDRVKHPSTFDTNDSDEPIDNVNSKIDYITDKDVTSINIVGNKSIPPLAVDGDIFNRLFYRIILKEEPDSKNKYVVALDKGEVAEFNLQCGSANDNVNLNARKLTMVHAVQRPLLILDGQSVTERNLDIEINRIVGASEVSFSRIGIKGQKPFIFPTKHVGEFRLIATCYEIEKDTESPIGYRWKVDENGEKIAVQTVKSYSNFRPHESSGKNQSALLMNLENLEDTFTAEYLREIKNFAHNFPDTRYREVYYELKAISKFRDFFSDIPNEEDFAVTYSATAKVQNSAKPKAPKINKIVPVFTWSESKEFVTRLHDKFRVYFDDDEWYTTGTGEGIAVIIMKNDSEKPEDNSIEEKSSAIFSQIGADPIQKNDSIPGLKTYQFNKDSVTRNESQNNGYHVNSKERIDYSIQANDTIKNEGLRADILNLKDSDSSMNNALVDSVTAGPKIEREKETNKISESFNYIVYPVFFDCKKHSSDSDASERFYIDIDFDSSGTDSFYFPFIKFALCRYQENSITTDYRFSNVVMTTQMQIIPKRTVNRTMTKKILDQFKDGQIAERITMANGLGKMFDNYHSMAKNEENEYYIIRERDNQGYYFEEYEKYEVDGKFMMDEDPKHGYSPRNDIRKRLVFSYKIS